MKILRFVLFALWVSIGVWIDSEYGLLPMVMYYIGALCFSFHYYNEKHKLYIETVEEGQRAMKYCFHTEQQAIDYCNHMNGELC